MARVKYYDQALKEWKYADAALNMKGKDGHTPVKGEDYFTDEDVEKIIEDVLEQGVLTYNKQDLSDEQKTQARENIGIDQISFNELTDDLEANKHRIKNLAPPEEARDAATKEFVENFAIEGSTYVATDDGKGNVTIRPYLADEDELTFKKHIDSQENPHKVTADQVGARPVDWKPTATEIGAATPQDVNTAKTEAVTAAQTYINTQVRTAAPRNLLDNSDFTNPVNQRGITDRNIKNEYWIDRWKIMNIGRVTFGNGFITITADQGYDAYLRQYFEKMPGFPVTVRIETRSGSIAKIMTTPGQVPFNDDIKVGISSERYFDIYIPQGKSLSIVNVAIYEGEYTIDTLHEYQSKGYEQELLICHQYDPTTGKYIGLRKFGYVHNLLDNSDFTNPVNQRGLTAIGGTGGQYLIDRWKLGNEFGTATLKNGYITVAGSSTGSAWFQQRVPHSKSFIGKTFTFATKDTDNRLFILTFEYAEKGTFSKNWIGLMQLYAQCHDTGILVSIVPTTGVSKDFVWAALYEGAYTEETLPEYHPKGYGAELAECQRYYYQSWNAADWDGKPNQTNPIPGFIIREAFTTSKLYSVEMPVSMRLTPPTIEFYSSRGVADAVSEYTTGTNYIRRIDPSYQNSKNFTPNAANQDLVVGKQYTFHYYASADL